jgi:hypothetical protein
MTTQIYESKPARLVVCERTGGWALALRRELAEAGIRVWETRSLSDCGFLLEESPASFVVVELGEATIEELLRFLQHWQVDYPLFRFAIVADRSLMSYEWFMRETGATHFLCSLRKMGSLADTVCRHLAQVPQSPQSLTERIWANLPWSREATS